MEVLLVTMFISLLLAALFVVAFFIEWKRSGRTGGAGREALLPFDQAGPDLNDHPHAPDNDEQR